MTSSAIFTTAQALGDWADVRAAFPGTRHSIYLNTGTVGIRAQPVIDALVDATVRLESYGQAVYPEIAPESERARAGIGRVIGAEPDELALCGNATDAVNWVSASIEWHAGDEVLLSGQEHPAMVYPWTYLHQRHGVVLKRFAVSEDPDVLLGNVRPLLTSRTRLIATSHVSSETGTRLPIQELAGLASEHGLLTMIDGAQAVGNIPVDVKALGCDFYAANGHKWLCGPNGTGFLWARLDRMTALSPAHVGAGCAVKVDPGEGLILHPNGRRFEFGTRDYARWTGMAAAMDWLEGLGGVERTQERCRELAGMLRAMVADQKGWTLHTPRAWEQSSAMTTFGVEGFTPRELHDALLARTPSIVTRMVREFSALRISTHYYNDESDVRAFVEALHDVTRR